MEELLARTRRDVAARKKAILNVPGDDRRIRWSRRRFHLIAEVKRSSLSAGAIRQDLEVQSLVRAYERAGAAAISILTEPHYFQGSLEDLKQARASTHLPLLQKDFILDEYQILEAKQAGADFVLLIARFLTTEQLAHLMHVCEDTGMNALVEVSEREELQKLPYVPPLLGVNARNLETLDVDVSKFESLRSELPETVLIAESGIRDEQTFGHVVTAGYNGALVGEHFLRAADPGREAARFIETAEGAAARNERKQRPLIKICGITRESDARAAMEAGADALGFIFARSPRQIDPEVLFRLRHKIPPAVLAVGVFKDQSANEIRETCRRFELDVAQIYDESDGRQEKWTARQVRHSDDLQTALREEKVLWDVKVRRTEQKQIWEQLSRRKVFALAGNLTADNVREAVEICRPQWIDVASGVEKEPGIKDPQKIQDFIRAARLL